MDDIEKKEALNKAKEMFAKFDVDNENHSAVVMMHDNTTSAFRMLVINADSSFTLTMLTTAIQATIESLEAADDPDRTLN